MHRLGEMHVANPCVEREALHDFEVHVIDHVPSCHGAPASSSFRQGKCAILPRLKPVLWLVQGSDAFSSRKSLLAQIFCAKASKFPGQAGRFPGDNSYLAKDRLWRPKCLFILRSPKPPIRWIGLWRARPVLARKIMRRSRLCWRGATARISLIPPASAIST